MDKQNYTLRGVETQALRENWPALEGELAEELETRILKRKRVLKSIDLLLEAVFLYIVEQLSFQRLSDIMSCRYGVVMSDTAWRKQLLKAAPILEEWVLQPQEHMDSPRSGDAVLGCSHVYAVDATNLPEQGGNSTSRRVHTVYSILEHRCTYTEVTDRHGGERLTRFPLRPGALYLADRAYGRTAQIAYAIEHQAHIVARISPGQVALFTAPDCREKLSFPDLLKGKSVSTLAYFKQDKKVYKIRIVGAKLPKKKQAAAQKRARRNAIRKQHKIFQHTLHYANWVLLATTLPNTCSDADILEAYRLRWQIELHFKRAKTHLNFHKIRRSFDSYKDAVVSLWLTLSFLISVTQLHILRQTKFAISDFNAFSLATFLFR